MNKTLLCALFLNTPPIVASKHCCYIRVLRVFFLLLQEQFLQLISCIRIHSIKDVAPYNINLSYYILPGQNHPL